MILSSVFGEPFGELIGEPFGDLFTGGLPSISTGVSAPGGLGMISVKPDGGGAGVGVEGFYRSIFSENNR
jgi:hypothetical protein